MKLIFVAALALVAGISCVPLKGILKDASTTVEEYPTVVQVEFFEWYTVWTQKCGGTILTSMYFLSGANCFTGYFFETRFRRIRAGATYRDTGGDVINVESVHNHPSFGTKYMDGNISVIRLVSRLIFSPSIQQATIVIQGGEIPGGLPAVHVGWPALLDGIYFYNSEVMLAVKMTLLDHEACAEQYGAIQNPLRLTENMICASLPEIEEDQEADMCTADFGGPIIYDDIVIGVASWSSSCSNSSFATVNTKVSSYTDWIIETAV